MEAKEGKRLQKVAKFSNDEIHESVFPEHRNRTYETHHYEILKCIEGHLNIKGGVPSVTYIENETRLSRKTITDNLDHFSEHHLFKEHLSIYKMLVPEILQKVYDIAKAGNVKAAALFFKVTGIVDSNKTVNNNFVKSQQNYVQINGTTLDQKKLESLSYKQREQIEEILKQADNL